MNRLDELREKLRIAHREAGIEHLFDVLERRLGEVFAAWR